MAGRTTPRKRKPPPGRSPKHKSFGKGEPVGDDEWLTFDLDDRDFRAMPRLPLGAYADLVDAGALNVNGIIEFMRRMLHPDDVESFNELIVSKSVTIKATQLRDITMWLCGEGGMSLRMIDPAELDALLDDPKLQEQIDEAHDVARPNGSTPAAP